MDRQSKGGDDDQSEQTNRCDEIENFIKIGDDVSILYDSILTPRSSIGPNQLYKTTEPNLKAKLLQKSTLDRFFKRKQAAARESAEESDHADSGKGESDHDTINVIGGPRCDQSCLRLGNK